MIGLIPHPKALKTSTVPQCSRSLCRMGFALLALWLTATQLGQTAVVPVDPFCGPEILTVADAWQMGQKEWSRMRSLSPQIASLENPAAPTSTDSNATLFRNHALRLKGHLRFLQTRTSLPDPKALEQLSQRTAEAMSLLDTFTAQSGPIQAIQLLNLSNMLAGVQAVYPAAALDPYSPMAMTATGLPAPTVRVQILQASLIPKQASQVRFRLTTQSGKPIPPGGLIPHQERLLHALLLDPQFKDYQHEHPTPTDTPGEYQFTFTPRESGNYRLWVNLVSMPYALEEFPWQDLLSSVPTPALAPAPDPQTQVWNGAAHVAMRWPGGTPTAGRKTTVEFSFTDTQGMPLHDLEKVMGAFGHLVGFCEDYRTLLHVHPEPASADSPPDQKGGPILRFSLVLPKAGTWRLYLQTAHHSRVLNAPFTITVPIP